MARTTRFLCPGHDKVNVSIRFGKQGEEGPRSHLNCFPEFYLLTLEGKLLDRKQRRVF